MTDRVMSEQIEDPSRRHQSWKRWFLFDELGIALAAILFVIIGAVSNPYSLTIENLAGILQNVTFLGFLTIGVGLALMAGEIDISVGSIFGIVSVVVALLLKAGYSVPVAVFAGLGIGSFCGFLNGIVAQLINVPAVVVTLATLGIYRA